MFYFVASSFNSTAEGVDIQGQVVYGRNLERAKGQLILRQASIIPVPVGKSIDSDGLGGSASINDDNYQVQWTGTVPFDVIWDPKQKLIHSVYAVWPDRRTATSSGCGTFEIENVFDLVDEVAASARAAATPKTEAGWLDAARQMNSLRAVIEHCVGPVGSGGKEPWRLYYDALLDLNKWASDTAAVSITGSEVAVRRAWLHQCIEQLQTAPPSLTRNLQFIERFRDIGEFFESTYIKAKGFPVWNIESPIGRLGDDLRVAIKGNQEDRFFRTTMIPDWERQDAAPVLTVVDACAEDVEIIFRTLIYSPDIAASYRSAIGDRNEQRKLRTGAEPDKEMNFRIDALSSFDAALRAYASDWAKGELREKCLEDCRTLKFNQLCYFFDALRLLYTESPKHRYAER